MQEVFETVALFVLAFIIVPVGAFSAMLWSDSKRGRNRW